MKAKVFFYNSLDNTLESGKFYSLAEALREDFVRAADDTIIPTDACSIVCWYPDDLGFDRPSTLKNISGKTGKPITKPKEKETIKYDMSALSKELRSQMLAREMGWEVLGNGLIVVPGELRESIGVRLFSGRVDNFYLVRYVAVAWFVLNWATKERLKDDEDWQLWCSYETYFLLGKKNMIESQCEWLDIIFELVIDVKINNETND